MSDQTVISSRVRLARDYEDLPFDTYASLPDAESCISRTTNALRLSGMDRGFSLMRLSEMSDIQCRAMMERRLITKDLLEHPLTAAVLLNESSAVSILMNEEDHLRILANAPGMDLQKAADACFRVEDALSRQVRFAFDAQLGFLTACPTNTGTGMRASLLMHLPMLTQHKQMGNVSQLVAKVGLTIRGVYGEGNEALGNLYLISNQVTLGRTEHEIISTVTAVGHQLTEMELALREKALRENLRSTENAIWRSWGHLLYSRLLPIADFYRDWSNVRLGAASGLIRIPLHILDEMPETMQEANLCAYAERKLTGEQLDGERADRIRLILENYSN